MKTIHNRVTTSILIFIKHNFSDWLIRIDKICDIEYEKFRARALRYVL